MFSVETKELTKNFDEFQLKALNLKVGKGEIIAFLGPNGSGKTTVVRLLTGQYYPDGGDAYVLGVDVKHNPVKVRELCGIIPEQENPPSFLTVKEYLHFICKVRKLKNPEREVKKWLKFLFFESQKNLLIKDLSRGTKQKLIVAQAFIHNPKLVFIDEPLINLDPLVQKRLKKFIVDYAKKGNTVFLSTHVLEIAEDICTSVSFIQDGAIVASGTKSSFLKKYKTLENAFIKIVKQHG